MTNLKTKLWKLFWMLWNLITPFVLRSIKRLTKRQCIICGDGLIIKGEKFLCSTCREGLI